MRKKIETWSLKELRRRYASINFPEYQREPNVWERPAKQRLIDSILRDFDIASIYMYENSDGSMDCIDGRQRITSIMSFLGQNPGDEDNDFPVRITNEIYEDESPNFAVYEGDTFAEIERRAKEGHHSAKTFLKTVLDYEVTVVLLAGSREPGEFNLQFTRLNLGTIINSGEKLHAMVGQMRDLCFADDGLGKHPFLEQTNIPTRRFAREQVAATLLSQVVSREKQGEWTRTRHFDLQKFFKEHSILSVETRSVAARLRKLLDILGVAFEDVDVLRNRAMTVSTVLLGWEHDIKSAKAAQQLAQFLGEFMCRLQWQVRKGLDADIEYRYLIDFQRHVTQASVEKLAVDERAKVLEAEFNRWLKSGIIQGDNSYKRRTKRDPAVECEG